MQFSVLKCVGSGGSGVLFQPTNKDYKNPREITLPYTIKSLNTSGVITSSIDTEGKCYFWTENRHIFLKSHVKSISCGWSHVLLLTNEDVFVYGKGSSGQLGLGKVSSCQSPSNLNLGHCLYVACGFRTSYIIHSQGTFVFGENHKFQLGLGHKNPIKTPVNNTLLINVTQIAGGNKHAIACKDNILYTWGTNTFGQLGPIGLEVPLPVSLELSMHIKSICSGWNHIYVLLENGDLLSSGKGDLGQNGLGGFLDTSSLNVILQGVDSVSSGSEHGVAVSSDKVYTWGWNEHGNLATGDINNRCEPTLLGFMAKQVWAGGAVTYFLPQ